MNSENENVKKYRAIAENILTNNLKSSFVYHSIDHTRSVVNVFEEIGEAINLSEKEMQLGLIAAWFHDTGYSIKCNIHEFESIKIFDENRNNEDFTSQEVSIIHKLILSTKMPQRPSSALEEALCDADLHHLGTDSFYSFSKSLKKEIEIIIIAEAALCESNLNGVRVGTGVDAHFEYSELSNTLSNTRFKLQLKLNNAEALDTFI